MRDTFVKRHRYEDSRLGSAFFVLLVIAAAAGTWSCDSTEVQVVVPVITALSDSTLSPGDTLAITGTGFAAPASANAVTFNNPLAKVPPDSATATFLRVVVPPNANSGPLRVTSNGVESGPVSVEIERGIGDVWTISGGANLEFTVPVNASGEEYLLIAESATSSGASFVFDVTPGAAGLSASTPAAAVSRGGSGEVDFAAAFEARAREEAVEYLRTHGGRPHAIAPSAPAGAPQETAQFYVLKCTTCSSVNASSFARVTATLMYSGTRCLVYADDNQPTGSFEAADYEAFGAQFDGPIWTTNTTAFGPPSDIDGNGRIIILFTPVVNDLTPDGQATGGFIAGFVLLNDLAPDILPAGTTNGAEIFYSMVPDPNGEYGNTFHKSLVGEVVPGILAHEFEHMISYGYRFVVLGGGRNVGYLQATWLEEGMAHMAEDLNGMDEQNIRRANLYLAEPYAHSLLGNAELSSKDTLQQRGGIFLFLRYLGDQLGEGIFKTMLRSKLVGTASVEAVTGVEFHASVNDYLAALYLSDRGITSDSRYEYASFDMQTDFAGLRVTDRAVQAGPFSASVRSATGNFVRVTGASPPGLTVRVSSPESARIRVTVTRIK